MNSGLRIAIIEPSYMIRNGLEIILRKQSGLPVSVAVIDNPETWEEAIKIHNPDLLIVNPQVLVHLFDGTLIDGLRAQVFDPSQ